MRTSVGDFTACRRSVVRWFMVASTCANSDVLAKHIPGARLVKVPGGSHGFNFETPDVFNREVLGFLETVRA